MTIYQFYNFLYSQVHLLIKVDSLNIRCRVILFSFLNFIGFEFQSKNICICIKLLLHYDNVFCFWFLMFKKILPAPENATTQTKKQTTVHCRYMMSVLTALVFCEVKLDCKNKNTHYVYLYSLQLSKPNVTTIIIHNYHHMLFKNLMYLPICNE